MAQIRGNQRNSSTCLGLSASFRDDGMNWGRIEVSWWAKTTLLHLFLDFLRRDLRHEGPEALVLPRFLPF